jgi:hypothetical protein
MDALKVEGSFKVQLHPDAEVLTTAIFNPNGINFALGTSHGNIFFGSLRDDAQSRPKLMLSKLEIAQ